MSDPTTPPAATWQVLALIGRTGTSELLVDASGSDIALPVVSQPPAPETFATTALLGAVEARVGQPIEPRRVTWIPEVKWISGTVVVEMAAGEARD